MKITELLAQQTSDVQSSAQRGQVRRWMRGVAVTTCLVGSLALAPSVNASTVVPFIDDFEDLNHDGWGVTSTGGGTTGVEFVNESNWAYALNVNSGKLSLSREFSYQPDYILSFDMQALANAGRGNYGETFHSASGVTVSFENKFNVSMGDVSFVYATSVSMLPSNSYAIANTPESFEAKMSEWADIALVDPASNISSVSLEFWAIGHAAQIPRGVAGPAEVRFDNVLVSAVPEADTWAMLMAGLGTLGFATRRRRAKVK